MPLRSKLKLFEEGDQLICVHDYLDLEMGDTVVVERVCDDCLGLMFPGHPEHYQDAHFEKLNDQKVYHVPTTSIDKMKVANVFTDLIKVMMMNSHRGVFTVDPVINAIKHNAMVLGIERELMQPLNKPEEDK